MWRLWRRPRYPVASEVGMWWWRSLRQKRVTGNRGFHEWRKGVWIEYIVVAGMGVADPQFMKDFGWYTIKNAVAALKLRCNERDASQRDGRRRAMLGRKQFWQWDVHGVRMRFYSKVTVSRDPLNYCEYNVITISDDGQHYKRRDPWKVRRSSTKETRCNCCEGSRSVASAQEMFLITCPIG